MPLSIQKTQKLKHDLISFIQTTQFKKAEKLYLKHKNQNINDVEIWRYFAGIHSERTNFIELTHCCKKIISISPDDFQATYTLAVALQNTNMFEQAIEQYDKAISINPDFSDAYINSAHLLFVTGKYERSSRFCQIVLKKVDTPEIRQLYAETLISLSDYNNALIQLNYVLLKNSASKKAIFLTAQCYYEQKNYIESEKHYLTLLRLDPDNFNVINNLGRLYEEVGQPENAIKRFREAIRLNDKVAITHLNLGKILIKAGDFIDAKKELLQTIELLPGHPEAYFNIGKIYNKKGKSDTAKDYFLKALDADVAKYMIKADEFKLTVNFFLSNIKDPELFSDDKKAFVANLFDGYADKFDQHLIEGLQYKTPEIINELVTSHITKNANITIDLGCGTGLCCKYLRELSSNLIGVDLSAGMIEKAHELNCYDSLIIGEITEVVNDSEKDFDLVVAADVFVYIASLSDIFKACTANMTKGAYFIFSTESLPDEIVGNYRLFESGRYKHSNDYINQLSTDNGFELIEHKHCTLRKENNTDVKGCVTTLRKI